jgi:hypothetical protein
LGGDKHHPILYIYIIERAMKPDRKETKMKKLLLAVLISVAGFSVAHADSYDDQHNCEVAAVHMYNVGLEVTAEAHGVDTTALDQELKKTGAYSTMVDGMTVQLKLAAMSTKFKPATFCNMLNMMSDEDLKPFVAKGIMQAE